MAREFTPGLMAGVTRVNTKTIKNMALAPIIGQMEKHMKAIGMMESSMAKLNLQILKAKAN